MHVVRAFCLAAVFAATVVCAHGCLVPFAAPPLRGSATTGAAGGSVGPDEEMAGGPSAMLELRGAVHPLQFDEDVLHRRWDFGLGWLLQSQAEDISRFRRHGPYLELGYRAWQRPFSDHSSLRLSVHGGAELLIDDSLVGGGGSLGATIELVKWASGPFESTGPNGGVVGTSRGESAIGLVARTSYRAIGRDNYWLMTVGVSMRTPAFAGMALAIPH